MDDAETIYLNIAGFNIKINFYPTQWKLLYRVKKNEIRRYWSGFIVNQTPKKIDYRINFVEKFFLETIVKKKQTKYYISFFEEKTEKETITYYQISFIQFQLILRQIINDILQDKGFIVHGSASNINGRALIFLGPSTAGKSTTMKLINSQYPSLADDTVIIKKENNKYLLYQTPFIEKESWVKKTYAKYEIKSVFFIKKANFFKIIKIINKNKIFNEIAKQFWTNENIHSSGKSKALFQFTYIYNNFYYLYLKKNKREMINFIGKL